MTTSQTPLKIGILLRNRHDGPGGLEKVLEIVAKAMPKKNVELRFYGLYVPTYDLFTQNFQSITYLQLPKVLQGLEKLLPPKIFRVFNKAYVKLNGHKLFDQMQADNLDVLITMDLSKQFLGNYQFLKDYKEQSGVSLLSWVHSSLSGDSDQVKVAVKEKIGLFDGHLAISKGLANQLMLQDRAEKIKVIYNPVSAANIVKRDPRHFLYIGRIDSNKRVHGLLEQLQMLEGNWRLDIYGSTGSISSDEKFKQFIRQLKLSGEVWFHGWENDPWKYIEKAGVLLLNSKNEGFGLVIVEAMMRGIPVLSSNCPVGPQELIIPSCNGWLYSVNKESDIGVILQEILNHTRALPNASVIRESVVMFEADNYISTFLTAVCSFISMNNRV